jgi:deazaflavin-dependent oxidoreductase (nitroreductase family)
MRTVKSARPPTGIVAALFRMPIYLYRTGFGWLFGQRLLLLTHIGRVTHRQRHTVLEVVEHDRTDNTYVVASGWGPSAQWHQNIIRQPQVTIRVGRREHRARAVPLTAEEGGNVLTRYASRHRTVATQLLPRLLGMSVDGPRATSGPLENAFLSCASYRSPVAIGPTKRCFPTGPGMRIGSAKPGGKG